MNRTEKTAVVERLRTSLENVPAVLLADFCGMTVEESDSLRRKLEAEDVRFEVVKNTLVKRAIADTPMESLSEHFKGNTAIAYHAEDPVAPAKIISDFAKDNEKLVIKAGWLEGKVLDEKGVEALSKLPGKDELRAKLLSVMVGVPTKFVRTLAAGPQTFVQLLKAREDSLG